MSIIVTCILLSPLLGFLILGLGFKSVPRKFVSWIGPGTILVSFILSIIAFINIHQSASSPVFRLFDWIAFGNFNIPLAFLIDPLSCLMMLIVTGVGFIIHVYSIGYMGHDEGYNRFFAYMNLFVFSMLLLVMGSNYLVMFIGWEGVGLCSYLLIGFWFKNQDFNNAAKKAFIMNRIGDLGFILGIFLLYYTFKSLEFDDIFRLAKSYPAGDGIFVAITLLLFIGAVGKSAQIPLYTWLPDAMAGPTPVSALIHAATMVTAGVYMVARSNILYALAPATMMIITITGLATALFAASIAIFQNDIKKILAYSTISQLGYMFLGLGIGSFTGAMFHLTTHAFFKALLFLAAGSIIHALNGEQDIRKMGGLKKTNPVTYWTFVIGTVAIAGIPPLSGFFSKDEILTHLFRNSMTLWVLAVAGALMTAYYMFRLLFITFNGHYRGSAETQKVHESPAVMRIPLIILAILSILGGMINIPEFMGGSAMLERFLSPVFSEAVPLIKTQKYFLTHSQEWMILGVPLVYVLLMILSAYGRFVKMHVLLDEQAIRKSLFIKFLYNKYYIDELYEFLFVRPFLRLSRIFHEMIELKLIDRIINLVGTLVIRTGDTIRYMQTGHVGFYLFMMIMGIILILVLNILVF